MFPRWCRFVLLVYVALFLNAVVPGHTRGAITLTGKTSIGSLADLGGCCSTRGSGAAKPSSKDRASCAICFVASHLTAAPPPVLELDLMGPAEDAAPHAVVHVFVAPAPLPFAARGPPAMG